MRSRFAARRWCFGAVLVAALGAPIVCAPGSGPLEAGFVQPPREARLRCYWWWLNGHTTEAAITRDLEEMQAKGYGGALLVDAGGADQRENLPVPAGPMFGSAEWRKLYRHALAEASRLGLELTLQIQSGWNLGGPSVRPEQASKLLTFSRTTVEGPREFHERLPQPKMSNGFYKDIAALAYPLRHGAALPARPIRQLAQKSASVEAGFSMPKTEPLLEDIPSQPGEDDARLADVRDLSAKLSDDGTLTWSAPSGTWEILRAGYTCSGAQISTASNTWQGLAIDHMDRTALETYWRAVLDPLMADARPYRALRYLATDSWELGGTNWTGRFREEFRQRRGYDPVPYLPIVAGRILESRDTSNRFLNDLRRTVGDLIVAQHYAPLAELAARYGLGIHPESGGPHGAPVDALETLGASTFPQTEFWARSATHRTRDEDRFFVKEAASVAHTYGKTLVAAEGPTSIGPQWEESLGENLRPTIDQALCEGLNRLVWHTFTSSPKEMGVPGQEYFAGTHLNPNVTWWGEAGAFTSYINRSQFLMQQGLPVADVVYYYGDQVPNFAQLKASDPAHVLPGYDYDAADEHVLTHRMSVRDGRIVLPDGMSYRLLVLPPRDSISLDALRAVRKLVLTGATVIGPKPRRATGIADDREVRAIADELWDSGKVRSGVPAREALGEAPDFAAGDLPLDYIHRRSPEADIYFVRNAQAEAIHGEIVVRVAAKAPELWHADTGTIEPQPVYRALDGGRTALPLRLEPYGSVFVVFRRAAGLHVTAVTPADADVHIDLAGRTLTSAAPGHYQLKLSDGATLAADVGPIPDASAVAGSWTVSFTPGWGAPAKTTFDHLVSWTDNTDPGIRYYSGTATYHTRFEAPADTGIDLDLGDVREIAHVRLNGRDLGVVWKRPFRIPLDGAARRGWNDLEVDVTNYWPNRLIGDQLLPESERRTHTNITKFHGDSPLRPSGLLGPVTLRRRKTVKLQ